VRVEERGWLAGFEEETCREKGKILELCSKMKEKDVRMSNNKTLQVNGVSK